RRENNSGGCTECAEPGKNRLAAKAGGGESIRRSVGTIASFAVGSNWRSAPSDWKRGDVTPETRRARKTQKPRAVFGKGGGGDEQCSRLNPIAGSGGNPEATCALIF